MDPELIRKHGLNLSQWISLAGTLRGLEKTLNRIEVLLAGPEEGLLSRTVTDFSAEQASRARELVVALRREIEAVAAEFGLEADERDGRREIIALLSIAWEQLEDDRSAKLGRYGAVDPGLQDTLDPHVERLIQLVLAFERLVRNRSPG